MTDALKRHLTRVAYERIEFPAVEFRTAWGHDSAKHQGLGTDGASVQWTGRKPKTVTCKAAFFNSFRNWPSDLFPNVWRELTAALEAAPQGTLTHPTRGNIRVQVDEVGEPLEAQKRNGVYLDLQFTEVADPAAVFIGTASSGELNAPGDAMTTHAATADAAALAFPAATRPLPILTIVEAALATLEGGRRTWREATAAVAAVTGAVADRLALPAVALLAGHDYRAALEALRAAAYAYRAAYLDAAAPGTFVVQAEMSLARIAALPAVYGDPSKAAVLQQANAVPDAVFVPRGTVLLVPRI